MNTSCLITASAASSEWGLSRFEDPARAHLRALTPLALESPARDSLEGLAACGLAAVQQRCPEHGRVRAVLRCGRSSLCPVCAAESASALVEELRESWPEGSYVIAWVDLEDGPEGSLPSPAQQKKARQRLQASKAFKKKKPARWLEAIHHVLAIAPADGAEDLADYGDRSEVLDRDAALTAVAKTWLEPTVRFARAVRADEPGAAQHPYLAFGGGPRTNGTRAGQKELKWPSPKRVLTRMREGRELSETCGHVTHDGEACEGEVITASQTRWGTALLWGSEALDATQLYDQLREAIEHRPPEPEPDEAVEPEAEAEPEPAAEAEVEPELVAEPEPEPEAEAEPVAEAEAEAEPAAEAEAEPAAEAEAEPAAEAEAEPERPFVAEEVVIHGISGTRLPGETLLSEVQEREQAWIDEMAARAKQEADAPLAEPSLMDTASAALETPPPPPTAQAQPVSRRLQPLLPKKQRPASGELLLVPTASGRVPRPDADPLPPPTPPTEAGRISGRLPRPFEGSASGSSSSATRRTARKRNSRTAMWVVLGVIVLQVAAVAYLVTRPKNGGRDAEATAARPAARTTPERTEVEIPSPPGAGSPEQPERATEPEPLREPDPEPEREPDPALAASFREQLADPDPAVRAKALRKALAFGDPTETLELARQALRDPEARVREEAASVLGRMAIPEATDELTLALRDPDPGVRMKALDWLRRRADPRSRPALEFAYREGVADGDFRVKRKALNALKALGPVGSLAEELLDEARLLYATGDRATRQEAIKAIGDHGDARHLEVLARAAKDPRSSVREQAALALGRIGSDAADPILISLAKDPNKDVRLAASSMLKQRR